jgi:histidyl-tRNA synthetase
LADTSALARDMRETGIHVDQSVLTKKGMGDQLKYADRRGIPFAIIQGPDEITRDEVAIKNLRTGEQLMVARPMVVQELSRLLKA